MFVEKNSRTSKKFISNICVTKLNYSAISNNNNKISETNFLSVPNKIPLASSFHHYIRAFCLFYKPKQFNILFFELIQNVLFFSSSHSHITCVIRSIIMSLHLHIMSSFIFIFLSVLKIIFRTKQLCDIKMKL